MTRDDFAEMMHLAFKVADTVNQHDGDQPLELVKFEHQTDFDGYDIVTLYVKGLKECDQ